jgi:diadenosine tetraphosphatase ApaH/serine/threonine PP2A family protein phosphatase
MKYAIFSDIHGNVDALDAVLDDILAASPDKLICLGDLVGYGASPNECVRKVRESGAEVVQGNHDQAAITLKDIQYFNDYARAAILWTHAALTEESTDYLSALPFVITVPGIRFVHASPLEPEQWEYVLSINQAAEQLEAFTEAICFIGHSHYPGLFRKDGARILQIDFPANETVQLAPEGRYLVNVGSVGQPRDNDWRAAWTEYDDTTRSIRLHRLEYPVDVAQARILEAGLPAFLAQRIGSGV